MKVKVISIRELKLMEIYYESLSKEEQTGEKQTEFLNQHFKILKEYEQTMSSHSQYIHLKPIRLLAGEMGHKDHNLMVLVIEINKKPQSEGFERNDIYAICTQN